MKLDDIEIIMYNPFFCSELLVHFLNGCQNKQIKNELIFLVLPFVLQENTRLVLNKVNNRSSLYSLFLNSENKQYLGGIEKRHALMKNLTNQSIIVLSNHYDIEIDNFIILKKEIPKYSKEKNKVQEYYKAAHYLGVVLSKENYVDVYIKLGLKEL